MISPRRAILLGAACGFGLVATEAIELPSIAWTVAGAGLCLALGRPPALLLGSLLLTLSIGSADRGEEGAAPASDRPATLVVEARSHWRRTEWGYTARVRPLSYQQAGRVKRWRRELILSLGGTEAPPPAGRYRVRGYVRRGRRTANFGVVERSPPPQLSVRARVFLEALPVATAWDRTWVVSRRLRDAVEGRFGDDPRSGRARALFRALVLGDRAEVPSRWVAALRRTGTVHLLAVSGLHVALLLGALLQPLGGAPRGLRAIAALAALAGYLLLVGPRPSLLRAAVMAAAALLAFVCSRPAAAAPALEAATVGLIAVDPAVVVDRGFQLTVVATAALVAWAPRWERPPRRGFVRLLRPLAATWAAQLATAPLLLPSTGLVPVTGPVANLLAGPWIVGALLSCFAWLALGLESTAGGRAWMHVVDGCGALLDAASAVAPAIAPVVVAKPSLGGSLVGVSAVALALRGRLGVAGLLLLSALAPSPRRLGPPPVAPEVVVLDVGQGDAILVRDGERALLVDGGGWRSGDIAAAVLLPALAAVGVHALDGVVVTHPDRDHCQGVLDLSLYLSLGTVWLPPGWADERCSRALGRSPRTRAGLLWQGRRLRVGAWRLRVLSPPAGERRAGNDASLVLLAELPAGSKTRSTRRVLLTGDVEATAELELVRRYRDELMPIDVLKLAHHGSKTSSTHALLTATAPALAVASAGRDNPYGHPAEEVRDRLRGLGVRLLRTDRDGACRFVFGGGALRTTTAAAAAAATELNSAGEASPGDRRSHGNR